MTTPGGRAAETAAGTIREALRPGEELLWAGAPDPRRHLNHREAYAAPMTTVFGIIALLFAAQTIGDADGILEWIGAAAATAGGLFIAVGRFAVKARQKRRIGYAVTAQRAIIAQPGRLEQRSLADQSPTLRRSGDGRHLDATFDDGWQRSSWDNTGMSPIFPNHYNGFVFYDVPDPESLARALAQARSGRRGRTTGALAASDAAADADLVAEAAEAMPPSPEDPIRAALRPGERLLWQGGPDPSRHLSGKDVLLIPVGLLAGGWSIWWGLTAAGSGSVAGLIGLPGLIIGLFLVGGRFVPKARAKRGTRYAVTTQRALIIRPSGGVEERSLAGPPAVLRRTRSGGHASVRFELLAGGAGFWDNTGLELIQQSTPSFAFYDVAEPAALESALTTAQQSPRRSGEDRGQQAAVPRPPVSAGRPRPGGWRAGGPRR